ncbi:hypothetical protein BDZ91DRAFT_742284 [Kalaharituber pfeilii]|nr:hypothetical protein BDZ91DRAFT_742284 [Kalaharituber pfeilii]
MRPGGGQALPKAEIRVRDKLVVMVGMSWWNHCGRTPESSLTLSRIHLVCAILSFALSSSFPIHTLCHHIERFALPPIHHHAD